jgi:hypothetical protein
VRRNYSLFFFVIVVFSTLSLVSCNQDSTLLGLDLLPQGEKPEIHYVEFDGVLGSMITLDNLNLYGNHNVGLVGTLIDPEFGKTEASLIVQFVPYGLSPDFGSDPVADSLIVTFRRPSGKVYGDNSGSTTFNLYRLTTTEFYDTTKYPVTLDPNGLYNPDYIVQSVVQSKDTIIRFNLDVSLARTLISMNDDTASYSSRRNFLDRFRGFYLNTEYTSGLGNVSQLDLIDSKYSTTIMKLYYHKLNDTVKYSFVYFVTNAYGQGPAARINILHHDYSNAAFSGKLNDTSYTDSLLYLQGMAGIGLRLRFPVMDSLKARTDSTFALHKVEIDIPVSDTSKYDSRLYRPSFLSIYRMDGDTLKLIDDHASGNSSTAWDPYLGNYNLTSTSYKFLATHHFQRYLLNHDDPAFDLPNCDLYLYNSLPRQTSEILERVILANNQSGRHIKLKVTYSLYPKK